MSLQVVAEEFSSGRVTVMCPLNERETSWGKAAQLSTACVYLVWTFFFSSSVFSLLIFIPRHQGTLSYKELLFSEPSAHAALCSQVESLFVGTETAVDQWFRQGDAGSATIWQIHEGRYLLFNTIVIFRADTGDHFHYRWIYQFHGDIFRRHVLSFDEEKLVNFLNIVYESNWFIVIMCG